MQLFLHGNSWLQLNGCCLQIAAVPTTHLRITPAAFPIYVLPAWVLRFTTLV